MPYTSQVVAGSQPDDFCTVRHVQLHGDYREIGHDLADIAWSNHRVRPVRSTDPALARARRRWRELCCPQLQASAQGVADRWALPADDTFEAATLPIGFPRAGCSVAWLPSTRTTTGSALLSRNFDFPTLTLSEIIGSPPRPGEEPFARNAYILQTRPSTGHATLTITAFDLLSGATDGINDAGLVAALLSDDESTTGGGTAATIEPTYAPAAGVSEIEVVRFLLETCADVDEALQALHLARHYYFLHPQHFIVADRSGRSFVYEYSAAHNGEHVTWGEGLQVVTNHLLYRYPSPDDLPEGDGNALTYARFRTLTSRLSDQARYSPEEIADRHAAIRFASPGPPVRTLWYALYDTQRSSVQVSFHLGDSPAGERRTPLRRFGLAESTTTAAARA